MKNNLVLWWLSCAALLPACWCWESGERDYAPQGIALPDSVEAHVDFVINLTNRAGPGDFEVTCETLVSDSSIVLMPSGTVRTEAGCIPAMPSCGVGEGAFYFPCEVPGLPEGAYIVKVKDTEIEEQLLVGMSGGDGGPHADAKPD